MIRQISNYILSPVGLLGKMGRFTAGNGRNKVPVVNALRTNGQCNLLAKEKSAQTITNFNRQGILALCSRGTGVIVNVSFVPSEWSGLVLAAGQKPSGEKFAADLTRYCYWFVFLPGIKEAGSPVPGFDLPMAGVNNKAEPDPWSDLSPEFKSIMRGVPEHIVFVDPRYFAGGRGQDFGWVLFLGLTLGRVVANQWFNQTERQEQTGLSGTKREEIIEAFALRYQYLLAAGYVRSLCQAPVVQFRAISVLRSHLHAMDQWQGCMLKKLSRLAESFYKTFEEHTGIRDVDGNGGRS